MKKTLLLQTALVAAAGVMLADASFAQVKAEPLGVTVGGYMTRTFKVQDRDKVTGSAQTDKSAATFGGPDAEIWFSLRAVLDNGLRIGGRVELEGATDGDQIDESYVWFENDLGRIELGSTDRVASKMQYFSPNATLSGQNTGQVSENAVFVTPANNRAGGVTMWFANASNDAEGINFYTSSNRYFGSKAGKGLQLGYSYTPDGCQDYNNAGGQFAAAATITNCDAGFGNTNNGTTRNQHTFAGNYLESFGDFNVALYGGYISNRAEPGAATAANAVPKRVTGWQAGAQVGYNLGGGSTITVGGGLKDEEVSRNDAGNAIDRKAYVVGVYYLSNGAAPGSIGVGADYWWAKGEETAANVKQGDDKGKVFQVGVSYQLATGIKLYGGAGTYKYTDGNGAAANESKANFGLLGVNLVF
ncbi:porin [Ferrovibrio sp. MS7]|uniref:porin n=1 Tax=Ferrovibrio plantarum TaxID=3119164 RepID=UPI0031359179